MPFMTLSDRKRSLHFHLIRMIQTIDMSIGRVSAPQVVVTLRERSYEHLKSSQIRLKLMSAPIRLKGVFLARTFTVMIDPVRQQSPVDRQGRALPSVYRKANRISGTKQRSD